MTELRLQEGPRGTQASWLFIIISGLLCLGGVMVFSAGAGVDQAIDVRQFWKYASMRQIVFIPMFWIMMALVSRLNYRPWLVWREHFWISPVVVLFVLSVILSAAVLVPGIGTEINGARRWIKLGPAQYGLTFQPSELTKWMTVMFLAAFADHQGSKIRTFLGGFVPSLLALGVVVALIGKEDFGTAALVGAMGAVVMLAGGVRWWHCLTLLPLAAAGFYFLVYCNDYRWARVLAFIQQQGGSASDMAEAYHAQQSIMAIASGGLWGVGLGQGRVKLGWVPEDMTDFIFAVIGEELGLAGCTLVIGAYIALMIWALVTMRRAPDHLGKLLAIAVAGTIGAQAAMNLAVVTGLAPTKGIALPFVSAGGSGLLVTAAATGVLLNVARQGRKCIVITDEPPDEEVEE